MITHRLLIDAIHHRLVTSRKILFNQFDTLGNLDLS